MKTLVVRLGWLSQEPYGPKYERLRKAIRQERQQGRRVVLVGVSAGASLGLLAFAESGGDVLAFVSVCGFTQLRPTDVTNKDLMKLSWFRAANRAELVARTLTRAERARILSLIARSDKVIEPRREYIGGAKNVRLYSHGHLASIVVALVGHRRRIVRFVEALSTSRD